MIPRNSSCDVWTIIWPLPAHPTIPKEAGGTNPCSHFPYVLESFRTHLHQVSEYVRSALDLSQMYKNMSKAW